MITHAITTCYGVDDIKRNCEFAGSHFFDKSAMRFFNSRLLDQVYHVPNSKDLYFITSEQFIDHTTGDKQPRLYTIRKYNHETIQIETIGEFQQYSSVYNAKKAILDMI